MGFFSRKPKADKLLKEAEAIDQSTLHANLNDKGVFEQRDDRGPFISTYSGALFFVNEMNVKDIPILDIAQAL